MAKLIPLEDAAKLLGMTPDELGEMRSRNEIFGYRDGASWKFKEDEIQRVASLRASSASGDSASPGPVDESLDPKDEPGPLGDMGDTGNMDDQFDLKLSDESDAEVPLTSSSDIDLSGGGPSSSDESELALSPLDDEFQLEPEEKTVSSEAGEAAKTAAEAAESSAGDDELKLAPDLDDLDAGSPEEKPGAGNEEFALTDPDSSDDSFSLSDDELVLSGEDSDEESDLSELTLDSSSDVDLSLDDIDDSGLESVDLSDDDMLTLGDEIGESVEETQTQSDDDFLLTPADESGTDEAESASQVIALDESFEESSEELVAEGEPFLEEAVDEGEAAPKAGEVRAPVVPHAQEPEAEYSIWNVLGLFLVILVLLPTGIMMVDLMRNMWSWNQPFALSSWMMDTILSMFG